MKISLPRVVIGTHHKSGTVLMRNIVRDMATEFDVPVWIYDDEPEPATWNIYLDFWSRWQVDLDEFAFRGIHLVRRPEALIYSATLYHLRGSEQWLHDKKDENGVSYYANLHSLNPEEQLLYEMNRSSKYGLDRMAAVASDSRFFNLKLEDVSNQRSMTSLAEAFLSVGVSPADCGRILQVAQRHCLWHVKDRGDSLAHSTTGVSEAWRDAFTPRVWEEFDRLFGDLPAKLGY